MKVKSETHFFCTVAIVLFILNIYRAAHIGMTWDEVDTYTYQILNFSFRNFLPVTANNHLLNSFLGYCSSSLFHFAKEELVIRFHMILLYGVYLIFAVKITRFVKPAIPAFALLVGAYYVFDYFALARGYGIAVAFVMASCFYYIKWVVTISSGATRGLSLIAAYLFGILACLGNTIALLFLAPLFLDSFFRLLRCRQLRTFLKKWFCCLVPIAGLTMYCLYYHLGVMKNDGSTVIFQKMPHSSFGKLMFPNQTILYKMVMVGCGLFLVGSLVLFRKQLFYKDVPQGVKPTEEIDGFVFVRLFLYYLLLIMLCRLLFSPVFPVGRLMLPIYPILALSFVELIALYGTVRTGVEKWIGFTFTGIAACSFLLNFSFNTCIDWSNSTDIKDKVYNALYTGQKIDIDEPFVVVPTFWFYHDRILEKTGVETLVGVSFPKEGEKALELDVTDKQYVWKGLSAWNPDYRLEKDSREGQFFVTSYFIAEPGKYRIEMELILPNAISVESPYIMVNMIIDRGLTQLNGIRSDGTASLVSFDAEIDVRTVNAQIISHTNISGLVLKGITVERIGDVD